MFLAAIAHAESVERRTRFVDLRNALVADASGVDDALRKMTAAVERLADLMKAGRHG